MKLGGNGPLGDGKVVKLAVPYSEYPYVSNNVPVFQATGRWATYVIPLSSTNFLKLNIGGSGQRQPLFDLLKTIRLVDPYKK